MTVTNERPFHLPPQIAASDNLTARVRAAAKDEASPFDGDPYYEDLFDQLGRALHRNEPRHALLVGERGVGQQAVVVELARRAATGKVAFLRDRQFVTIDCKWIARDESRMRLDAILSHIANTPDLVVCIEGLASLLANEGAASNRSRLLWGLSRAACRVIGLVTPNECDLYFGDDPDAASFFSAVPIEEPEPATAVRLLQHYARGLEHRFEVAIDSEAIALAVRLTHTYILNAQLPHKALRVLHAECEDIRYERTRGESARREVTTADVVRRVAALTGIPETTLLGTGDATDYRAGLTRLVVGQEHVVSAVASELRLVKAGLVDPGKPASVMLFVGQTGTGKTELAKALARFYSGSRRLKVFTLGNFVEPHSVSGIIGVPPGYVGHEQGGRLVNELLADPYSVFLLDEADKAHPDVMQPFLNLFDEGWIYDQRGVKAYGDKAMFILTTNVGQRQIAEMTREGKSIDEITARLRESLTQIRHSKSNRPVFTAELLARIKQVLVFRSLTREAMVGIAERVGEEVATEWRHRRGRQLEIDPALFETIGTDAHRRNEAAEGREGGRIVRKLFSERIEAAIQERIASDPELYRRATKVVVHADGEAVVRVSIS